MEVRLKVVASFSLPIQKAAAIADDALKVALEEGLRAAIQEDDDSMRDKARVEECEWFVRTSDYRVGPPWLYECEVVLLMVAASTGVQWFTKEVLAWIKTKIGEALARCQLAQTGQPTTIVIKVVEVDGQRSWEIRIDWA